MKQGSPIQAILLRFLQRRERIDRLASQVTRSLGRARLHAERYGNYASGRQWTLLGDLQELSRHAHLFRRSLSSPQGRGESRRAALLSLARVYERVNELSNELRPESPLVRELSRVSRPLQKLEKAFGAQPLPAPRLVKRHAGAWSVAAKVAAAEPTGHSAQRS